VSDQIPTAFVQQYGASIDMLVQQEGSRLRNAVSVETGIVGTSKFFDQIGTVTANKVQNRHGDSPLNPTPHARRRVSLWDYDIGDLFDDFDKVKTLIDPTNPYVMAQANALGRAIDVEILTAMYGTSYTGVDGTTLVTSGWSTVAVNSWAYGTGTGNAGMTVSKLIEAKTKLLAAEALMPGDSLYVAMTAADMGALLATTEVTSSDYNTVKALVNGEINSFMGANFIRTELIPLNGSSQRRCPMWTTSGMKLGIGIDVKHEITRRADKRFSWYAYSSMSVGATRMQELKLAEIICA